VREPGPAEKLNVQSRGRGRRRWPAGLLCL